MRTEICKTITLPKKCIGHNLLQYIQLKCIAGNINYHGEKIKKIYNMETLGITHNDNACDVYVKLDCEV